VPVGSSHRFEIRSVDLEKKRIGVALVASDTTRQSAADVEEAAAVREYAERPPSAAAESFGSLADRLRGAFKPREK
jgi:hypothetical protein